MGDNTSYDTVLSQAHSAIEHAAGPGIAANDLLRKVPTLAKKLAAELRELRNRYGTGHGRPVVHNVTDEVVEVVVHGALIWTRWALERLQTVLLGAVEPLVRALREDVFYGGDLAERLLAANVPDLVEHDQRRLGLAVGQRTARNTFNVRIEGVEACSAEPTRWPDAYRAGVVEGLFLNEDGQVATDPDFSVTCAAEVLKYHSSPDEVLGRLRELLGTASWTVEFQATHARTIAKMQEDSSRTSGGSVAIWDAIAADLEALAPHGVT
ncbi:hypothetical protein [Streptomyces rubiginosohelvolus]|uniref:hypothetical protein n=1 Tax=Streptomyces rubiginosohelvolus TaxID=67362 RepID=UPI00343CBA47